MTRPAAFWSLAPFLLIGSLLLSDGQWKLKKVKKGIQVYTMSLESSKIKRVKIVAELDASLSCLMELLWDTEQYTAWVPHCKSAFVLEEENDRSVYYYASSAFPWPLQDRDLVAYSTYNQSYQDYSITIRTTAAPAYPFPEKGMIRVKELEAVWHLKPLVTGNTQITYTVFTDPGGNVPVWGVNKFMDKGPIQTIEAMRELAKKQPYKNAVWEGIIDPY